MVLFGGILELDSLSPHSCSLLLFYKKWPGYSSEIHLLFSQEIKCDTGLKRHECE